MKIIQNLALKPESVLNSQHIVMDAEESTSVTSNPHSEPQAENGAPRRRSRMPQHLLANIQAIVKGNVANNCKIQSLDRNVVKKEENSNNLTRNAPVDEPQYSSVADLDPVPKQDKRRVARNEGSQVQNRGRNAAQIGHDAASPDEKSHKSLKYLSTDHSQHEMPPRLNKEQQQRKSADEIKHLVSSTASQNASKKTKRSGKAGRTSAGLEELSGDANSLNRNCKSVALDRRIIDIAAETSTSKEKSDSSMECTFGSEMANQRIDEEPEIQTANVYCSNPQAYSLQQVEAISTVYGSKASIAAGMKRFEKFLKFFNRFLKHSVRCCGYEKI